VFGLDALRTTAILCVVLAHGGLQGVLGEFLQKIPVVGRYAGWSSLVGHGGAVGVEIFFVLSGFLIGGILLRTGEAIATREGLVGFYIRRWFRTLPLFALALAVNVLFEQYVHAHPLTAGEVAGHGFFLRNFSHISLTFFPESWSLATEEWFYLLFPAALFAIVLTSRVRFARAFVIAATVFFLFSTGARIWGAVQPGATWAGTQRCTVIYRFDALMTGVLAAWFSLTCATAWRARARVLKYVGLGLFLGGYAAWWTFHLEGPAEAPDSFFARTFRFTIMSISVALLLPALSQWKPASEGRVHAVVRQIAIWSYALYLVHWPLFQIVGGDWAQPWQRAAGIWYFIAKVLLAIAIAAILHRVFEAPAMRLRNRWRASRAAATAEPVGASADAR
jgi:peptidoglycan/LPS O-acetylase OafA/YrhL